MCLSVLSTTLRLLSWSEQILVGALLFSLLSADPEQSNHRWLSVGFKPWLLAMKLG